MGLSKEAIRKINDFVWISVFISRKKKLFHVILAFSHILYPEFLALLAQHVERSGNDNSG
jgi:hypothetical protein